MCGLVFADLRQVKHHHFRRPEDDGAGQRSGPGIAGRQIVGGAVLADSLDPARLGIGDGDEAELDLTAIMRQPDDVGGIEG